MTQMNYLNKALDLFNTAIVSPVYYVMFTVLTILASIILFQDIQTGVQLATEVRAPARGEREGALFRGGCTGEQPAARVRAGRGAHPAACVPGSRGAAGHRVHHHCGWHLPAAHHQGLGSHGLRS